jgi:hypothetical protein
MKILYTLILDEVLYSVLFCATTVHSFFSGSIALGRIVVLISSFVILYTASRTPCMGDQQRNPYHECGRSTSFRYFE